MSQGQWAVQMQNEMDREQSKVSVIGKKYGFNREYWLDIAVAAVAVKNIGLVCWGRPIF